MRNKIRYVETPTLHFRTLVQDDALVVQQFLANNKAFMLPWIPWAENEPQTVEEKQQAIQQWEEEFLLDKKYIYGY